MDKEVLFVFSAIPLLAVWAVFDWIRTNGTGRRGIEPSWIAAVAYLVPLVSLYVMGSPPWFTAIFLLLATVAIWAGAIAATISHVKARREKVRIEAEREARKLVRQGLAT